MMYCHHVIPHSQLQMDGVKPYSIEAKVQKLAELNDMSKTSGIPKFSTKLFQTGFKLNRIPATTFQVRLIRGNSKDILTLTVV